MSVWKVNAVADEPETRLLSWRVMELTDGSRHLVGYAVPAREGRTSSVVEEFDIGRLRAVTGSGRVYKLVGPPGHDSDALYVWDRWRRINEVAEFTDITTRVWSEHLAAVAERARSRGTQS